MYTFCAVARKTVEANVPSCKEIKTLSRIIGYKNVKETPLRYRALFGVTLCTALRIKKNACEHIGIHKRFFGFI